MLIVLLMNVYEEFCHRIACAFGLASDVAYRRSPVTGRTLSTSIVAIRALENTLEGNYLPALVRTFFIKLTLSTTCSQESNINILLIYDRNKQNSQARLPMPYFAEWVV